MTTLDGHGRSVELLRGWEGEIYRRGDGEAMIDGTGRALAFPVIVHLATFELLPTRGDYGGGNLGRMGSTDIFVSLLEHTDGSTGAVFSGDGVPWPLDPDDVSPERVRVPQGDQSGCQRFFRIGTRTFTLYVVVGSHTLRRLLVPRCNAALTGVRL